MRLIPAIDVASYYRACLFMRIHNSQMSTGQLIQFELDNTLPSDEDPAEFIERTGVASPAPLATLDIDDSSTALTPGCRGVNGAYRTSGRATTARCT